MNANSVTYTLFAMITKKSEPYNKKGGSVQWGRAITRTETTHNTFTVFNIK